MTPLSNATLGVVLNKKIIPSAGSQLKQWRISRGMSQLALALEANLSTRHLSCVETNKSQPSREALTRLADALQLSMYERNALWRAAGFVADHPETELSQPALAQIQQAIDCILAQQEPYPAFLLDRHWQILQSNAAADRLNRTLLGERGSLHNNILLQFFDPNDLRGVIENWLEVAVELIRHVQLAIARSPLDERAQALLQQMLSFPDVPKNWRTPNLAITPAPILTTTFKHHQHRLRFFSAMTSFGMPRDVTLEGLHIESCFPVDQATAEFCRNLSAQKDLIANSTL